MLIKKPSDIRPSEITEPAVIANVDGLTMVDPI